MRILYVAMPEAIHTARWIEQLSSTNSDLHLFPSRDVGPVAEMPSLTFHTLFPADWREQRPDLRNVPLINWPFRRGRERLRRLITAGLPHLRTVAGQLALTINRLKPDIVHTLEMQLAGYLLLEAMPLIKDRTGFRWIYSCWGNDITFYANDPAHRERIQKVLSEVDYYSADCPRDITLIEQFSPRGRPFGVFPTGGGYDLQLLRSFRQVGKPSDRKTIAVKGYHSEQWTGRAIHSLRALQLCKDVLGDRQIVVYRPSPQVQHVADYLARFEGMNIVCLPPWIDNLDVIRLMGGSRLAISTNSGDGTPNAMLEAMIMGAFPIQSSTADTVGWIRQGVNGLIVPFDDIDAIAAAIRKSLIEDNLVDIADEASAEIVYTRLDRRMIASQVIAAYQSTIADRKVIHQNTSSHSDGDN